MIGIDALSISIAVLTRIDAGRSSSEVVSPLMIFLRRFGFQHLLITGLPNGRGSWNSSILHDGWPTEWLDRYTACKHFHHDPCVDRSRVSAKPFLWQDIASQPMTKRKILVMEEANEFRMSDGLCVPIHRPLKTPAVITTAGEVVDLDPDCLPILEMVCLHTFRRLSLFSDATKSTPSSKLTEREREIMLWIAAGKSAEDVACILSISRFTVERHLGNIREKYDCANTVHAVVIAIGNGEIHP